MKAADPVDAARVELFLADLRLPAIKQVWGTLMKSPIAAVVASSGTWPRPAAGWKNSRQL